MKITRDQVREFGSTVAGLAMAALIVTLPFDVYWNARVHDFDFWFREVMIVGGWALAFWFNYLCRQALDRAKTLLAANKTFQENFEKLVGVNASLIANNERLIARLRGRGMAVDQVTIEAWPPSKYPPS